MWWQIYNKLRKKYKYKTTSHPFHPVLHFWEARLCQPPNSNTYFQPYDNSLWDWITVQPRQSRSNNIYIHVIWKLRKTLGCYIVCHPIYCLQSDTCTFFWNASGSQAFIAMFFYWDFRWLLNPVFYEIVLFLGFPLFKSIVLYSFHFHKYEDKNVAYLIVVQFNNSKY